jgi:MoaA/NifB/PqqE/SkfB family radical SAM enzyme/SAM-dependent methyltransferase
MVAISKTACVIPWTNFVIRPDGSAHFCCDVLPHLTVNGRPGNIGRDDLDDLWNADELVDVRATMARGERPASCSACWKREAEGSISRRLLINPVYRDLGGALPVEALAEEGAETGYRLKRRPDWFVLELGNVCNLKCRSCNPLSSSRIAADRTQVAWTGPAEAVGGSGAWFKDIDKIADMIAGGAKENAVLSLMGGEPFLIDHTWRLLEELIARGVASRIYVGLSTNGQQRHAKLEALAPQFRGFNVSVSIDAYGKLNDYLRHGSEWPRLVENVGWFRSIPNVLVSIVPTLQNCNALDMTALVRFADERDLALGYNALSEPARLRPTNLPPNVRRIAAQRLRAYLDAECKPTNAGVVQAYFEILETPGDAFDAELFHEFMTFTNDLDVDRGERLADAAPELVALIRAAGIEWSSDRRHVPAGPVRSNFESPVLLRLVNRTVSPEDVIFTNGSAVGPDWYFQSAADQLVEIDLRLRENHHPGLAGSGAVADFASHYGRMTRVLRAALPHAAVYACDIDVGAVQFCVEQLGALPVVTGWQPDEDTLPEDLDAIVCVSLLTHTPLEHWRSTFRAWTRMLRPGGAVAFTYLSERYLQPWRSGEMEHYGGYSPEARAAAADSLREGGFAFSALPTMYGGLPLYGIAFATAETLRRELAAAGLELLPTPPDTSRQFAQDLVLARKPRASNGVRRRTATVTRDVSLIALYDPRCYAPAQPDRGDPSESIWSRLTAIDPPKPFPTELGFADPRIPEVREAQASLAREHGVDAFCYLYPCGPDGARWDAPLRDLLATGRPDLPFCLAVTVDPATQIDTVAAERIFDGIAPALADPRYLRVGGEPLVVVRELERFIQPRAVAAAWRAAAARRGLGSLHLCAALPAPAEHPEELGFDSMLEASWPAAGRPESPGDALAAPWPAHRLFRTVSCRRDPADRQAGESYELWLQSAISATRAHGEKLVFVDAWNDWLRGAYLEPDDADGRTALLATRRAARGPASGLVLWRRLCAALGTIGEPAAAVLGELGDVLAVHERARDRLLASVEVALGRNGTPRERLRRVPIPSRQLPPSGAVFGLDIVGEADFRAIGTAREPILLRGDFVRVAGWIHSDACAPPVDVFVALESPGNTNDRVFRVGGRVLRPDVAAAYPGFPDDCGFETTIDVRELPAGTYSLAIVQSTLEATYRDSTGVAVKRETKSCSSG